MAKETLSVHLLASDISVMMNHMCSAVIMFIKSSLIIINCDIQNTKTWIIISIIYVFDNNRSHNSGKIIYYID